MLFCRILQGNTSVELKTSTRQTRDSSVAAPAPSGFFHRLRLNVAMEAITSLFQWVLQEKFFWRRAIVVVGNDIFMQVMRAFFIYQNLAITDAGRTISQTILIVVHVWTFLFAFYKGSKTVYYLMQFGAEIGYLTVRLSLNGPLAMATTSFFDFLTLALPSALAAFELSRFSNFILKFDSRDEPSTSRMLKWVLLGIGFVVTGVGATIVGFCIYKGFIQGCPSVNPTEVIDVDASAEMFGEIHKLQWQMAQGTYCFAWVFNLFLSPGCSCYYLRLVPFMAPDRQETCAGLGHNEHEFIKDFLPHLEQLRFLSTDMPYYDQCALSPTDLELIASWTHLRVVRMFGFRFSEFPQSWKSLTNLVSLEIMSGRIEQLDVEVLNSWWQLEHLACIQCPHLESIEQLQIVSLHRLRDVEIYGVRECIKFPRDVNLVCVSLDEPEQCAGIPEFLLRAFVDTAANTETTACTQPACASFLRLFDRRDEDDDGIVDALDFDKFNRPRLYEMNFTISGFGGRRLFHDIGEDYLFISNAGMSCLARKTWNAIPFDVDISGYDVNDGWPIASYIAADFRHTMCTECPAYKEMLSTRYPVYRSKMAVLQTAECKDLVASNGNFIIGFGSLNTQCRSTDHQCTDFCRLTMVPDVLAGDTNKDGLLSPTEFASTAAGFSLAGFDTPAAMACLQEHGFDCFDSNGNITLHHGIRVIF